MFYHEGGYTFVRYAEDKRPLKLCVYLIDSPESDEYLGVIIDFVTITTNKPEHVAKMDPAKFWQLVERLTVMFCRAYSPMKNQGVSMPEVRGAVYFVLNAGLQAGYWPEEYATDRKTFVQYGGDFVD